MACIGNMPSFKYVTVENLIITYNSTPYPIKTFITNKKYVIWNVERPYQLEDSNVRPEPSFLEYLIVINDNGKPTIVEYDELLYSFDKNTNGSNLETSSAYNTLKNKVNTMTNVIGNTEELEDGTVIYNLNKVKSDSKSHGISIGEIKTKIDYVFIEIKPIILNDLVEYLKSIGEYKLSFTEVLEDIEITEGEKTLINTCKISLNNKLTKLQSTLGDLKAIIDSLQDATKSQLISDAKTKLTVLNNGLISLCESALLNNVISGEEKSNIIQKAYELNTYVSIVQNTCNNIMMNGSEGVIYSIQNQLTMLKDSTVSRITELDRQSGDLVKKYSEFTQLKDKFSWIVKGGNSESTMVLSDTLFSIVSKNITLTADKINLNGYVSNDLANWNIDNEGNINASNLDVGGYISTLELRAGNIECSILPTKVLSTTSIYVDDTVSDDSSDFEDGAHYNTLQGAIDAIPTFLNSCDVKIYLNKNTREDVEIRGLSGGACLIYLCSNIIYGNLRVRDNGCRVMVYGGDSNEEPTTLGTIKPNNMISAVGRESTVVVQSTTFTTFNFVNIYGKTSTTNTDYYYALLSYDGANVYSNGCKIIGCDNGFRVNSLGSIYVAGSFGKVNNYVFAAASGGRLAVNNTTQCDSIATAKTYCSSSSSLVISDSFSSWDGSTSTTGTNDNTITVSTKIVTYKSSYGDTYRGSSWKKDNTVREGNYGYGNCNGYWFFGTQFIDLKGKTITKVTIKITRQQGGVYGDVTHTLKAHEYGGRVDSPKYISGFNQTFSMPVGATKTITITNPTVLNAISSGSCKGFGLQSSYDKDTYSVCSGSATVTVTYK